jgi:uncharacterized protein YdeI (YjbR/CyaY-like superfamily)
MSTILEPGSTGDWRAWLAAHSQSETEIWLVIQHKNSDASGPRYSEAVEQALCFGWIDSSTRKHDAHSFCQRFSPRRPRSNWSEVNRERVARMIEQGLMPPLGLAALGETRPR